MKLTLPHIIILKLGILFILTANAAEKEQALTESSYKVLSEVQVLMEESKYAAAVKTLKQLLTKITDKTYDTAVTYQTLGYAYYGMDDLGNAKTAFIKALESQTLPTEVTHELEYSIVKLLMYQDDFKNALIYLNKWFEEEPEPNADAYLLAANIYHHLDQYKEMIPYLDKAIAKTNNPPISWFELLASAYIQTKQYKNAAKTLKVVVKRSPSRKEAWLQLAAVYQLSKQDKKALATTELAYSKGFLDETQIIALANNYLYLEMPFKAAVLLETEMQSGGIKSSKNNLELQATSWMLAQEPKKAAKVYQSLINNYDDENSYFLLGQIYYELAEWKKSINALKHYVTMDNTEHKGEAWLLLGIASYETKNKKESLNSFNHALSFKNTKEQAKWWIEQIQSEKEKLDS